MKTDFLLQLKLLLETGAMEPAFMLSMLKLNLYYCLGDLLDDVASVLTVDYYVVYSLFHVIVQNDEISTRIIRYLTAEKGGRVTFIPLNRVKAPHITFPHRSDVIPLLKRLKYSSEFAPAFAQVR